jgi:two-component system, NarL family, response regulator
MLATLETAAAPEQRALMVAVLADDDVELRRVAAALSADEQIISSEAAIPSDLPPEINGVGTDVVVIAARSSNEERTVAIREVKRRLPDARVVVVATADSNGMHRVFEAGADGFVFDSRLEATLVPTIRGVWAGQVVVPPVMRSSVVRPALTYREKQVLGLLVLGLTNGEIARRLYLAESTVKCHMTSIFSKLGVHSRSEAAAQVLDPQHGLGLGILRLSGDAPAGTRT